MNRIWRTAPFILAGATALALVCPGVAAAATMTANIKGGATITADVFGARRGEVCGLFLNDAHAKGQVGNGQMVSSTGTAHLDSGPIGDGRHDVIVRCSTDEQIAQTVFTGPLADVYQFLFNSGSSVLTPPTT
ncbi:hypothetical protein GCM10027169_17050 [Gordonia jinhuaensis]|uniref:Secreted protein n=1 Tax=Gordonia jinhuaensis TaxID=1517702 RepID=A0A916TJ16_9ACTN|nr:hypothetical protein [Gordonia jinhuaensis]GGB47638.1 hypothetical protein GCM10011489_38580 [Gordonia jinhuaensis]